MFIDIGANLTHESFAHDLSDVIQRAIDVDVNTMIVTGTNVENTEQAIHLTQNYTGLYATAGCHPHYAKDFGQTAYQQLKTLAQHPAIKAIGEIGLDFYRNYSTQQEQVSIFEQLLELAITMQLPVFVHERDAFDCLYPILKSKRASLGKIVIHCFTGHAESLQAYIDLDCYIGITGWICDERRGGHLAQLVTRIPEDRLMIETDAPYLLPRDMPTALIYEKRRNEPAYLPHIAQKIASCRGTALEDLAQTTTRNSKAFFGLA